MILASIALYLVMALPMLALNRALSARIANFVQRCHGSDSVDYVRIAPTIPLLAMRLRREWTRRNDSRRVGLIEQLMRVPRNQFVQPRRQRL